MISRRYIRVKVMQTLYVLESMDADTIEIQQKQGNRILDDKLNRTFDLLATMLLYTVRVAQHAEAYAQQRASKYLTTSADFNINTKIAQNTFVQDLMTNESLLSIIKNSHLEQHVSEEWVKKIFQNLVVSPEYDVYIATENRNKLTEKSIIKLIWEQFMLQDEKLMEYFCDELSGWEDDMDLIANLLENFFKGNPKVDFKKLLSSEKSKYAYDLLMTVLDKKDFCMEIIKPKLINWDAERVAIIDLILLCMGVCELFFFETIPTKVTINEYIEISKMYSTRQSGPFINGVLDNILKEQEKEKKINKVDRVQKTTHEA